MGNCLDRSISEDDEMPIREDQSFTSQHSDTNSAAYLNNHQHATTTTTTTIVPANRRYNSDNNATANILNNRMRNYLFQAQQNTSHLNRQQTNHPQQQQQQAVYYLTPNVQRTADQLTEEEQIKLLKRMALIQQLPSGKYDENKKNKECVICMIEFEINDTIKFLPCLHTFHQSCIDAWLIRSLICPSCMEPVDAGLLSTYEN